MLQRCCWVSEAIENDRLDIPALHESADEVRAWLEAKPAWTVRLEGRLVGGVRAQLLPGTSAGGTGTDGAVWDIGRLMVAPDLAGRGLGWALLAHAEAQAPPGVTTFVLFTGERSERNQRMYRRAGYRDAGPGRDPRGNPVPGAIMLARSAP